MDPLAAWERMAEAAYSKSTRRAMKADGVVFQASCERTGEAFLLATPATILAFVFDCLEQRKRRATIRRYVATIARVHLAAGLSSPFASESVRLALKEMGQRTSGRQRQALALG
jgi:hypothetical protein